MKIINNNIFIEDKTLNFGMSFDEVYNILKGHIFTKKEPDDSDNGHIIVLHQDFYGLKGTCSLYFQNCTLKQIGLVPDWNMYFLVDNNYLPLPLGVKIKEIEEENDKELQKEFSLIYESDVNGKVFKIGNICIIAAISRDFEQYSILIKEN